MKKETGKILAIAESISRKMRIEGFLVSANSSEEELNEIISTLKEVEKKINSVSNRAGGVR